MNELSTVMKGDNFRDAITAAEAFLLTLDQTGLPVEHHFIPGGYARKCFLPKGQVITGRIHLTEHFCIVAGHVDIAEEGKKYTVKGCEVFASPVGTKRILFTHEDTWFTTVHLTDVTDTDIIKDALGVCTYAEFDRAMLENKTFEVLP